MECFENIYDRIREGTVPPKCNIILAYMSTITCGKKSWLKVDMVPVSTASLHSMVGGVKTCNWNGCQAHF